MNSENEKGEYRPSIDPNYMKRESTPAQLLRTLRDLSSAALIAVALVGLCADKLSKPDQEGLLLIALLSFICGSISHWALINYYPKRKRDA